MMRTFLLRNLRVMGLLVVPWVLAACSTLGVRIDPREERVPVEVRSASSSAAEWLQRSEKERVTPARQLAALLEAARAAYPGAVRGDADDRVLYNAAVARVVRLWKEGTLPEGGPTLIVSKGARDRLDPEAPQALVPSAGVRISGLAQRAVQPGLGVPYVASFAQDSAFLAGQPGIPRVGMSLPATAVLTFRGDVARLEFYETLRRDHLVLAGRRVPLAADFSAPIAVLVSRSANRSIDLRAFLFTRQNIGRAGLYQYQPYDPDKIPVVFVHGLLSRPEAWTRTLNGLLADPEIRDRYQFWFLLYPTGLPIWKSASLLRTELDRFHQVLEKDGRNPNLHRMVLVGHSMGGLISSLVIRQGGDNLWRQFSDAQVESLNLSPAARRVLEETIYFPPRRDVDRVIFAATPHRGSRMATSPLVNLVARLVQLPQWFDQTDRRALTQAVRHDFRGLVANPASSLIFLRAESPLIAAIERLPLSRRIPYHSIIGDRGRGDSPNSSDGVVPYWSSHLPGAVSEKIVPSGHGVNENAEGIEEIRRILADY